MKYTHKNVNIEKTDGHINELHAQKCQHRKNRLTYK